MGQCVSKPPDGYTAPPPPGAHLVGMGLANGSSASGGGPGAGGGVHGGGGHGGGGQHHGAGGGGGHGAGAHADSSVHAAHAALGKRSFRSSNRSVIEGLASIYQVKAVLGSGAWRCDTGCAGHWRYCRRAGKSGVGDHGGSWRPCLQVGARRLGRVDR